jgi:hypothetical protein
MRVRTAVAVTTLLGTLGALSAAVASGATPIWNFDDLPAPNLTLTCPAELELGAGGDVSGSLTDADTGDPIAHSTVQIARSDAFGDPVLLGDERTANDGSFGPLSDTPANRGDQTYEVIFGGDADYAPASATCTAPVHGTDASIVTDDVPTVAPGEDVSVVGQLTADGDPVAGVEVAATDTVDGQSPTELDATPTDDTGRFTVTVPSIAAGSHTIDISYAGDQVLEPATHRVSVALTHDTMLTLDSPPHPLAGEDLVVEGNLVTASGDPVSDAEITATDAIDGQPATDLTAATTDSEGGFAIAVPSATAGRHQIDVSYAGGGANEATSQQVEVDVKHETTLTLDGPDTLPAEPGPMTFEITLTDGDGAPVADAVVELNDGDDWLRSKHTDVDGKATYTKLGVTNEVPLQIKVTYAGDSTHWEASTDHTWRAVPQYALTKDKARYVAGDLASFAVTTPDRDLPTSITLKAYRRPAVSITPSGDSNETQFSRKMYRNSTLTVSTEATDEYRAGSRTFTIRVSPQIKQSLTGWYDTSGDTFLVRTTRDPRLDAKVLPARPGRCVKAVVQKYIDGSYRTVQTSSCRLLDVESSASFKLVKDPQPGARFRMRFDSPADDMNIAGHGDWTYIRFTN